MEAPASPRLGHGDIQHPWRRKMRPATREEERLTEDEIARTKTGAARCAGPDRIPRQ